jgi:hypothetical protein
MISPFSSRFEMSPRASFAEAVLLQRADAELGVEDAVQTLGEVEVLRVAPDLVAEDQHRELVHAGRGSGRGCRRRGRS